MITFNSIAGMARNSSVTVQSEFYKYQIERPQSSSLGPGCG